MADGVILTPAAFDRVSLAVSKVEQQARNSRSRQSDDSPLVFGQDWPVLFLNDTEEEESIPPYAVLMPSDYDLSGDDPIIKVDQPDTDFGDPVVNGPDLVEYGDFAPIQRGRFLKVRFDPDDLDDGELTYGRYWGVKDGQYELAINNPGDFMALGIWDEDENIGWFLYTPCLAIVGKPTSPGVGAATTTTVTNDTPGQGTVTIWAFDGTKYVATTLTVPVRNLSSGAISSSDASSFVQCKRCDGVWHVDVEYC